MIDIDRLRSCLDDAEIAEPWLRSLCVANLPAAHANFMRMANYGVTLDLLTQISEQFVAAAETWQHTHGYENAWSLGPARSALLKFNNPDINQCLSESGFQQSRVLVRHCRVVRSKDFLCPLPNSVHTIYRRHAPHQPPSCSLTIP